MGDWVDELVLVDHHCHSVLGSGPDAGGFATLLTEGAAGHGFDSMLGLAVRRECAPVLDLPVHASPADYLARREELGAEQVTRRMLAASGTTTLLVDHGFRGEELLAPAALGELAAARVGELVRLESVAEEVAAAGVSAAAYGDAVAGRIRERAGALELAPFGKLLYSSDAFGLPELYLVAARAFRRAVRVVLGGWERDGEATGADVRRIAALFAAGNARRLYRLSES